MKDWKSHCIVILVLGAILGSSVRESLGEVRVPRIFSGGMVLQQGMEVPVWGWAKPGEEITIDIAGRQAAAKADKRGKWMVKLPAMQVGGPYAMTIRGENEILLGDVLVGEVWICSGQSNMQMGVGAVKDGARHVKEANHPRIRLFMVPDYVSSGMPLEDLHAGEWKVCTPENISAGDWGGFSAVGYFYGREIHKNLNVPVGLIDVSKGGTSIQTWTNRLGYEQVESLRHYLKGIEEADQQYRQMQEDSLAAYSEWLPEAEQAWKEGMVIPSPPKWPEHPRQDRKFHGSLYHAMIHPIVPYAIRGAIWYQGEANVWGDDAMMYCDRMKALVGGWRAVWGEGDFPFYYVQLAPYFYSRRDLKVKPDCLPRLWEGQRAALQIPNTGMAVTNDLADDIYDIHPVQKEEVGRRLSLWALAKTYGVKGIVYSGPLYRSMEAQGSRIRVHFDYAGSCLVSRDGNPLDWFEIAGADGNFTKAQAAIEGDTVVVWSEAVAEPSAVRFAWHCEAMPNLMNKEGLPAAAFRTDRWWEQQEKHY